VKETIVRLRRASPLKRVCLSGFEGGVDGAEADVAVDDGVGGLIGLDVGRDARGGLAAATGNTGLGGVGVDGVAGVKPEHVGGVLTIC
jgi:hypothetical protein